jgi:hypothetical protein
MVKKQIEINDKKVNIRKPLRRGREKNLDGGTGSEPSLSSLQRRAGNRAVQRLIVQRSGEGAHELEDETAARINRERGGGQPLNEGAATRMSETTGYDVSDVRVHTSPEADDLNRQLGARAFTTGKDIYFRDGAYNPHSLSGQELLAHELTHVVQQGTGEVGGSSRMTVNAPGDIYEQEADSVAKSVQSTTSPAGIQRQEVPEEEEEVQMQEEEEEEVQAQEEEEEEVQMQEEEEEEIQTQVEEEEEVGKG